MADHEDADMSASDSDSDFEVEADEEAIANIGRLEAELEANPNLYDKYVEVRLLIYSCACPFAVPANDK